MDAVHGSKKVFGLTVGFIGSGGAGKTPSPKTYSAGSRRRPSAAKPLSAANDVSRLFETMHALNLEPFVIRSEFHIALPF